MSDAGNSRTVLRVAVMTSSRQSDDVNRAYDLGADSYLAKPVTFETLTALVQSLDGYWLFLNEKPELEGS